MSIRARFVRRYAGRAALPVALLAGGLLLATTAHSAPGNAATTTTQNRLADLVSAEQNRLTLDEAREQRLQAQVEALTSAQAHSDGAVAAAQAAAAAVAPAAGLTAVHGPSLTVSLNDARRGAKVAQGYPTPTADDLVVHQQDVQAVVNALWAGGAEAMTIMGQRIISTSAVTCVGNTLLLQGRVYSPPFVVTAVGDQAGMSRAVLAAPGVQVFKEYVKAYGLSLSTSRSASSTLPAYDGTVGLTHALPMGVS